MQFCPKCSMALIPIKKEKIVVLACPKCGEETRRSDPIVQKLGTAKESIVVIGKGEKNLQTLPKMKVTCQKCGHGEAREVCWCGHPNLNREFSGFLLVNRTLARTVELVQSSKNKDF